MESFVVNSGNTINSTASIKLDYDGKVIERVAIGDGPVDACFKAVEQSVDMPIVLEDYKIRSVSEGEDALGEVSVKIKSGNRTVTGRGLSTDVVESSILAFLHGVNKLVSAGAQE